MAETIKKYLKYVIFSLRMIGLWSDSEDFFGTRFYWKYTVAVYVVIIGTFNLGQIVFFVINIKDLELLASSAHIALMFIMPNVKAYFYLKNWTLIKRLLEQLDDEDFQPKNAEQARNTHVILRVPMMLHVFYSAMTIVIVPMWLTTPFLSKSQTLRLPFPSWYPYDWKDPFYYKIAFIHQSIGAIYVAVANLDLDLITFALTSYIGVECDILSNTVENIEHFTAEKMGFQGIQYELEHLRFQQEMNKFLVGCVDQHRKIVKFAGGVNRLFGIMIFSQFTTSLFSICLTMFELTVMSPSSTEYLATCIFQFGVFLELLFYCWFGNEVISKSSNISSALYTCPWIEGSRSFKQNILFFMLRTQRPTKILAINFFELSLATFGSIMRISWSFFTMLRQLHSKTEDGK